MPRRTLPHIFSIAVLLCASTGLNACQWVARGGSGATDGDTTTVSHEAYRALRARSARLENQSRSQELDLAKTRVELERRDQLILNLQKELESARADLKYAERQFVTIERGLMREESRASAVSAIAEVRLLRDRVLRDDTTSAAREVSARIDDLIQSADRLAGRNKYAASVYYANRALRILNRTDREAFRKLSGPVLVVSVSRANLRGGPSSEYDVLTRLRFGVVVTQLDLKGDWFRVRTPSGTDGWLHRSLVR